MLPLDLTIAIPAQNEERNLRGCIEAIGMKLAVEIVLIDSGSTDQTKQIAKSLGVEVVDFIWDGKFPKKRNWFLQNYPVKTKWILFLDADEYLTDSFKSELRQVLAGDDKAGYWLNYTNYFLGKRLKGGYPLKKLALFKTGFGEYERIEEQQWSKLDMEVHEHPIIQGKVGTVKSKIDHKDFRSVSHYILKHNEYANWEVARFFKTLNEPEKVMNWTWKQRLKYRLMRSVLIGPVYFFGSFFLLGGFKDGTRGLAFAVLKWSYFNQIYCKIREQYKQERNEQVP